MRAAYRHAIEVNERLVAEHPSEESYRNTLGSYHNSFGLMLWASGLRTEATDHFRSALANYDRALQLDPHQPYEYLRRTRWFLATCPDGRFRDPVRVLALTDEMIAQEEKLGNPLPWDPTRSPHWLLRGVAFYRKGDFASAIDALDRPLQALPQRNDTLYGTSDLALGSFVLAMAYYSTGDRARARLLPHRRQSHGYHQDARRRAHEFPRGDRGRAVDRRSPDPQRKEGGRHQATLKAVSAGLIAEPRE